MDSLEGDGMPVNHLKQHCINGKEKKTSCGTLFLKVRKAFKRVNLLRQGGILDNCLAVFGHKATSFRPLGPRA